MGKYTRKLPFGTLELCVVVDYTKSMFAMFQDSGAVFTSYDSPDPEKVPLVGEGTVSRLVYLIPFFKPRFSVSEGIKLVNNLDLQQGKAEDLLAVLRDQRAMLEKVGVKTLIAFGTTWIHTIISDFNSLVFATFQNGKLVIHRGHVEGRWAEENLYIVAVAEDGVRRKIHQTPLATSSWKQPSAQTVPFTPVPILRSASLGIPKALMAEVKIDYEQPENDLLAAAGCNRDYANNVPFDKGKPATGSPVVKRKLILVPLEGQATKKSQWSDAEEVGLDSILPYLDQHNLQPAFAEDMVAFVRDHRQEMKQAGVKEFLTLGTLEKGSFCWFSFESPNLIKAAQLVGNCRGSFWALATLKKKAK